MTRTGGEVIIDYLISEKVEYVVGIPGHGCLSLFDALRDRVEKKQIKYIQVMQESDAVYIADGYYRATGKPLAVITSIGPGSLNTVIGLATAFVDSTSVLVLMGDTHTHMRGVGVLQEIERKHDSDVLSSFRSVTKRCWRAECAEQLPKILQRSFNLMLTGRRGPVAIAIPMDVQAQPVDIELPLPQTRRTDSIVYGDAAQIQKAAALMNAAIRPVIVAGGGVLHAGAFAQLQHLAEAWGAAVVTTMAGKSCFPENHPLYGWHGGSKGTEVGNYLCRTADVVLALGCRFADETTSSYRKGSTYNFPDTKLIQVDIDPAEIGKNYPCDIGILGDASVVMAQLEDALGKPSMDRTAYFADMQDARSRWLKKLDNAVAAHPEMITISSFLRVFKAHFPKDGIMVTSSGNSQAQVLQEYCFEVPGTHVTTGGFSTMGFSFPAAIGAKLGQPEKAVACIMGDGDFLMAMQEMSVLAQQNLNVLVVVLNNYGWMAIRDLQLDVFGKGFDFGTDFCTADGKPYTPDFSAAAQAFGIASLRVEKPEELDAALVKAINITGPVLLEVMVTNEYPFSGGSATGWWDVPIPAYMTQKRQDYLQCVAEEVIG